MEMKQLHVLTIVGTRPEIIRLSRVICHLNTSNSIKHTNHNDVIHFQYFQVHHELDFPYKNVLH